MMAFIKAGIELAWEVEKCLIYGQHAGTVINGVLSQARFSVLGFWEKSETIRCFDGLNILIPIVPEENVSRKGTASPPGPL